MSKKLFTEKEIRKLAASPYVTSISQNGITYTEEFKRLFISEKEKGKFASQIFEEHGLSVEVLGFRRVKSCSDRWTKAYKEKGTDGLKDSRKDSSGRPREKELSLEEKYKRLKAQNNVLKAENELLKKLDMMERRQKGNK